MSIKNIPPQPEQSSSDAPVHVPVLLEATLERLAPSPGESYLDLTAGYGGHARAVLKKTENYDDATLVDRDAFAIETLGDVAHKGVQLLHTDFVSAAKQLMSDGRTYDMILADFWIHLPRRCM
jgi:16S rRNA (cytosine1402-N4)-methyltransferase